MGFFSRTKSSQANGALSLYYASDVHGSEQCWRKFLGAARFYGARAVIMGGDLTGKAIVPIARDKDGVFQATFLGKRVSGSSDAELNEFTAAIRFNGMYPWITDPACIARGRADRSVRDKIFDDVMLAELRRWITIADEKMASLDADVFVMAGNDDPWTCDEVLAGGSEVTFCDARLVRVGTHEMISSSYANPTPWDSPRELSEDALYAHLKGLAEQLDDPSRAIMNLHVPPHASGLDTAFQVADDLTLVRRGGQPNPIPVGSTAVRQIIEEYQPLLSLHGHIHESRGAAWLGRTLAINSGSEYNTGRIHGAIVTIDDDKVRGHQFVVG